MPKLYDGFKRLITKYSVPFIIRTEKEGHFDGGKWVNGEPEEREVSGAIVPLPDRKVYSSGGYYTAKDRNLFMVAPMADFDKCEVIYKGNVYKVESETDYTDYADAVVYVLKCVSAFDRT